MLNRIEADQKEAGPFIDLEVGSEELGFTKEHQIGDRDVNLEDLMRVSMVSSDPKPRKDDFGTQKKGLKGVCGNYGLQSLLKKSKEPAAGSKSSSNEINFCPADAREGSDPNCQSVDLGVDCSIV